MRKLRVLFVCLECNSEWASVPLLGYRIFDELSKHAEVTLLTHGRNRFALQPLAAGRDIRYLEEGRGSKYWYRWVVQPGSLYGRIWALQHLLSYPIFREFDKAAYRCVSAEVQNGDFDIIHVFSPVIPRYPTSMRHFANRIPLVFGPVNGGLDYPDGFKEVGAKEYSLFNHLRALTAVLPGYRETYQRATKVLVGTQATKDLVLAKHQLSNSKVEIMPENAIFLSDTIAEPRPERTSTELKLITCGRLVPYKGTDMIIEAMRQLPDRVTLKIVGDGSERASLETQVDRLGLRDRVTFTGWIPQGETRQHYLQSDVFCFPSVREFGGAVALEAMAAGLPCIVADYGGLQEYVTSDIGFKIEPKSRPYVINEIIKSLNQLLQDPIKVSELGRKSQQHAKKFTWEQKGQDLIALYERLTHIS
jgi:glycosyltransferase involved in cell wall biosynthesis